MPDDNLAVLILCVLPFIGLIFLIGRLSVRRAEYDLVEELRTYREEMQEEEGSSAEAWFENTQFYLDVSEMIATIEDRSNE